MSGLKARRRGASPRSSGPTTPATSAAEGLQTSCRHGGFWGATGCGRRPGRGRAGARRPRARWSSCPSAEDSALLPSLLTLSDVFCTGHHCAVTAGVGPRTTVTVIGDGAVGLSAVLAAKRLGAERIILMGRHTGRTDLGPRLRRHRRGRRARRGGHRAGARADRRRRHAHGAGVRRARWPPWRRRSGWSATAARSAGSAPRSTPRCRSASRRSCRNITLTGGVAPARAYIEELLPDVLDGRSSRAGSSTAPSAWTSVPDGYRAMADREALKVLVQP